MVLKESEIVELKQVVTDDIKKSVIAFANCGGGTLYVGVSDSGEVVGLPHADDDLLTIHNMLRDGVKPDVTLFVQSTIEKMGGASVIRLDVQAGTERPYYLVGKGLRPEGVYVRHGAASVPATDTSIRRMIRETDGDRYEKRCSLKQDLTFEAAEAEFSKRGVSFGASQMTTLGLINADKLFTNLALLLSDQCVHSIKAALFQDTTQQTFKDRQEFGGSLFTQINEVYGYLDRSNKTASTFEGLLRVDSRDYPETALREALLNAVVHREYATSGSILIKIFSDRIEFISPGGLVGGLEVGDIMSGYSACRNPELAAVFYRLQLIEAYGTGILKIFEAYRGSPARPKIEVTPNVFKMTLPNLNIEYPADTETTPEEKVMQFARQNGSISRKQAEHRLGASQTAAGLILRTLVKRGNLTKEGRSRNVRYFVR